MVFGCFQGVEKECTGNKWVNQYLLGINTVQTAKLDL